MKSAAIGYVPPPSFGCAQEFWDNLQKYPPAGEIILFSDYPWPGVITVKSPEVVKGANYPDLIPAGPFQGQRNEDAGKPNPFAVNNLLWLTSLAIASKVGVSHMLYLESDCRVGVAGWDQIIFEEFFGLGRPLIAAGTLAAYNPCNYSPEAARRWADLVTRVNSRRNFPIATYGYLPAATKAPSSIFPNGALAVYDVNWMRQLWNLENCGLCAISNSAFDIVLGSLVWQRFQEDTYEVMGYLETVFSGYGDILTTEADRLQMLRDGRAVAVHQVKSKVNL